LLHYVTNWFFTPLAFGSDLKIKWARGTSLGVASIHIQTTQLNSSALTPAWRSTLFAALTMITTQRCNCVTMVPAK